MNKFKILICMIFVFSFFSTQLLADTQCDESEAKLHVISSKYGKPVPGSSGKLLYCDEYKKKFKGKIIVKKLLPSHTYVLSFNGKVGFAGNDPEHLPNKHNNEYFIDFAEIETDADGNFSGKIKKKLNVGEYDVKFLVKDKQDWKVVLHNDLVNFEITK